MAAGWPEFSACLGFSKAAKTSSPFVYGARVSGRAAYFFLTLTMTSSLDDNPPPSTAFRRSV
jgi:hypothetical protein